MSILLQHRALRHNVLQQLASLDDVEKLQSASSIDSAAALQERYSQLDGIDATTDDAGSLHYVVSWTAADDPHNPHNWSTLRRLKTTFLLIAVAATVTASSSIDSAVAKAAADDFGVADVTEALGGTGIFLIGFGVGALIASPLSELVGRYAIYVATLLIFGIWTMASALAPNIGAQIAFRFLAGLSGSAPLTVAGGTISDMYNAREKTWAFPLFAIVGFGGPLLGPVIGAYIPVTGVLSWHWADWVILIADGLVIALVVGFMEETLAPRLLAQKAALFRQMTGDARFQTQAELGGETVAQVLKKCFSRPFVLALEPIVVACTLYLTIIYIVLFTFLDGYTYIFEQTYNINSGLSNTIFVGLFIGVVLLLPLVPLVVRQTHRQLARDGDDGTGAAIDRESRLLFAMCCAPLMPIGLFWLAWTSYASISIWSPIIATVVIGTGTISVFISSYMYIIDAYEVYAASALTFVALVRYLAAGGMTVVGVPMYQNLGTHYSLTILACISTAALPIPYVLHHYGPRIRARSKYAVHSK